MSDPVPTTELKTYSGNCHCGAFKFHIRVPEITSVLDCDCSICFKKGYKWVFPGEGGFVVDKGEGTLKGYEFNHHIMSHQFCQNCGTSVLGKRKGMPPSQTYAVNVRALQDVDLWSLTTVFSDGTTRNPQYAPPAFAGLLPTPGTAFQSPKTYTGGCHCGLVTVALTTDGPLPDGKEYIQECDCSICVRNGTTLIYPHQSQVTIHTTEPLSGYSFAKKRQSHDFCPVCGISICIRKFDIPPEQREAVGVANKYEKWRTMLPINLRLFDGVKWPSKVPEGGKSITVKRGDWKSVEPLYVVPE